ncbi:MAG: hypothetical protein PWR01_1631 [Clostridiales bacterium]|nr:hypothetical protein [Clostridiales bacterium]
MGLKVAVKWAIDSDMFIRYIDSDKLQRTSERCDE